MMARNNITPWAERMLELLEQKPRSREWLIGAVLGLVPPGRAWRTREMMRKWEHENRGSDSYTEDDPNDDKIRFGARRVVNSSLVRLVTIGRLEQYDQEGETWVRYARPRIDWWTPEHRAQRGEEAKRRWEDPAYRAKMEEVQRREWAKRSPEERSAIGKAWNDALTPEQRRARSLKAAATKRAQRNGQQ
jgi:hypothetical protein